MKNTKMLALISAVLVLLAVGGGLMAQGEEGSAVTIHAVVGIVALLAAIVTAYAAAKQ